MTPVSSVAVIDWQLHNDLMDLLQEQGLGFQNGMEKTAGKQFVRVVSRVLFEVLPEKRLQRLADRGLRRPTWLERLTGKTYNHPTLHKHRKLPQLNCQELQRLATDLL